MLANNGCSVIVGIPTFNAESTIIETLQSLKNQTYKDFKVLIADNNSTDSTVALIEAFAWDRVQVVVHEKNITALGNFDYLISACSDYDFIAIYHSDDLYHQEMLESSIKQFQCSDVLVVSTGCNEIDQKGVITRDFVGTGKTFNLSFSVLFSRILSQSAPFLVTPSIMFRKTDELLNIKYSNSRYRSASDYYFVFELIRFSGYICYIDKPLINYRIHSGQGSQSEIRKNLNIPDGLLLYADYISDSFEVHFPLFMEKQYKLVAHLVLKCIAENEWSLARGFLALLYARSAKEHACKFILRAAVFFNLPIPVDALLKIRKILK